MANFYVVTRFMFMKQSKTAKLEYHKYSPMKALVQIVFAHNNHARRLDAM